MWQRGRGTAPPEPPPVTSGSDKLPHWLPLLPVHSRPVLPHTAAAVVVRSHDSKSKGDSNNSGSKGGVAEKQSGDAKDSGTEQSATERPEFGHALDAPPATLLVDGAVLAALRKMVTGSQQRGSPGSPSSSSGPSSSWAPAQQGGRGGASRSARRSPDELEDVDIGLSTAESAAGSEGGAPSVVLCLTKDSQPEPGYLDLAALYPVGVVATLRLEQDRSDNSLELRLTARTRVAITGLRIDTKLKLPLVRVAEVPDEVFDPETRIVRGLFLTLRERIEVLRSLGHPLVTAPGAVTAFDEAYARGDISACSDLAASCTTVGAQRLQLTILQQLDVPERLRRVVALVQREIEVFKLMLRNVSALNRTASGKKQQGNALSLGNALGPLLRGAGGRPEGGAAADRNTKLLADLNKKLSRPGLSVPEHARTVIAEEMERLASLDPQTNGSEHYSCRNYLQWLVSLPWGLHTTDNFELGHAMSVLNDDHFGIADVKDRILEFIAISNLSSRRQLADGGTGEPTALSGESAASESAESAESATPADDQSSHDAASGETGDAGASSGTSGGDEAPELEKKAAALGSGKILCLVGPPGVGKTSVGASIARALGRKFVRFSCGGIDDTAEIKGHRRTYVGAMPGKIVQALRRCEAANPVLLVDEIDKLGRHARNGDPSAALLEAFDPEQNKGFIDLYCDVPFDLSKILFVCTANTLDTIPRPLLDRMEVIEMSGYYLDEKLNIARRYLLPKLQEETGLGITATDEASAGNVDISDEALRVLIQSYCREAGVRSLQKHLERLFRKAAVQIVKAQEESTGPVRLSITPENLTEFVGQARFSSDRLYDAEHSPPPGCVQGMAWNSVGGSILWIESVLVRQRRPRLADSDDAETDRAPTGKLQTTGKLGDVIRESVEIAYSFAKVFGGEATRAFFDASALHTHFPEGATPKDGPSAGVTIVTSLLSLALDFSVGADTAMTGEISLTGKVLPVGGIKEKIMAARRNSVTRVFLPFQNKADWLELDDPLTEGLEVHFAQTYSDIFSEIFGATHWKELQSRQARPVKFAAKL